MKGTRGRVSGGPAVAAAMVLAAAWAIAGPFMADDPAWAQPPIYGDVFCYCDGLDLARFTGAYFTDDPKGDFKWDGGPDAVNGLDFALFAAHFGKSCDWQ